PYTLNDDVRYSVSEVQSKVLSTCRSNLRELLTTWDAALEECISGRSRELTGENMFEQQDELLSSENILIRSGSFSDS
ncbi:hypothetical protein L9F63_017723, partial [Diploptera punctata]